MYEFDYISEESKPFELQLISGSLSGRMGELNILLNQSFSFTGDDGNPFPRLQKEESDILELLYLRDYNTKQAQKLFLEFWKIPGLDPRSSREGIYFKQTKQIEDLEVEIIGLDTRYFRSPLKGKKNSYAQNMDSEATILGTDQWMWLETSIYNSTADVIVILSSIQILATNHPYEKWDNFPMERERLLGLIANASKNTTILAVSGDRHRSGIYQNDHFVEITASSLNKSASKNIETDPLLLGKTYPIKNFGILDIEPNKKKITLSIHDQNGFKLNSKIINLN